MQIKISNATSTPITTGVLSSLRVPLHSNSDTRQKISMIPKISQIPQLSTPSLPRVDHSTKTIHRHRTQKHKTKLHTSAPAHNTRLRTHATGPAIRTRALTQSTKTKSITQTGRAETVEAAISQPENDVHQDLAVMDIDTGKLLSYRQLMRNPKFKKNWSTSSANELGRLANEVGRRIKNLTNKIEFITRKEIPHNCRKYVTYGKFMCSVQPDKKEKNKTRLTVGRDKIDYPGEVSTPTAEMLIRKNPIQQHHLHKRISVHDNRHIQLLPHDA